MSVLWKWQQPSSQRQLQQISFRPALHVMAKLNVVKAMYNRSMTECINDLLADALDRLAEDLKGPLEDPLPKGHPDYDNENYVREHLDLSQYNDYMAKVEAETRELEKKIKSED